MAEPYDSTTDTQAHIELVQRLLGDVRGELWHRAKVHDASKFEEPEKSGFDIIRPRLDHDDIESEEYQATLKEFETILALHYANNRHHPEYHAFYQDAGGYVDHAEVKSGAAVSRMTLWDLVEMICDWTAASQRKPGGKVNIDWAVKRFGIEPQLLSILANTVREMGW